MGNLLPQGWKIADCPGQRIGGDRNTCTHVHEPGVLYQHEDERQVGEFFVAPRNGIPQECDDPGCTCVCHDRGDE